MKFFQGLFFLALFGLTACSQKMSHVYETVELAVVGLDDIQLDKKRVLSVPYASIYARIGDGPQVFMVLGFHENGVAKWISSDSAMIATRHGRLVKTIGLYGQNLDAVVAEQADPLGQNLNLTGTPKNWSRKADWSPNYHYNFTLHSKFELAERETIELLNGPQELRKVIETVTVQETGDVWQNLFWIEPESGEVLKSMQYLGPNMPVVTLTQLKRYQG